jgi:RNA polymerase sigma-70 factor (ECF subfamily)
LNFGPNQDELYRNASVSYGGALNRLARAYEADPDKCRDLLQEIHLSLWRSFEHYETRCSLRTWVYRVAHNTAASYVIRQLRKNPRNLLSLEELETIADSADFEREADRRMALDRLFLLIHRLKSPDRQLMLLYLEGIDAAAIAEILGISAGNVRIQIHRIKTVLSRGFQKREDK